MTTDTTFAVSPEKKPQGRCETVDYIGKLSVAFRRPIEATWLPKNPLIACEEDHALLTALEIAFYKHMPLRLSPDAIWITLARGFALHVNENAEQLRDRFVSHAGKQTLTVTRMDFFPGEDNPWPEVFEAFNEQLSTHSGGLAALVQADFSTTGPVERAVSHLMALDTFKCYFEYEMFAGCGIPQITLSGTRDDWRKLRAKAQKFASYGLQSWIDALDPVLAEFERAKDGNPDVIFWQSMYRFNSGSGPAVMTGWVNVLFPYLKHFDNDKLYPNPYLADWERRLAIDDRQDWRERHDNPQGVGIGAVPSCCASVPLKMHWGSIETPMRLVGGLMGVSQDEDTLAVEPECGWAVIYDEPLDAPPSHGVLLEEPIDRSELN